ncbi:RCC1 domain-containing protein [Bdellovibrio sp. HCB2-146]|uniref:RCC1 domain-containing protein n=1 Tax=Bdellovibrio sp. HCB2-146 TaxID=3394362 RepID=UPI0039BD8B2D
MSKPIPRRTFLRAISLFTASAVTNQLLVTQSAWGFLRARLSKRKISTLPPGLYSWGLNTDGVLGQGHTSSVLNPTRIGTDTTWSSINVIAGQAETALALKQDGTIWGWGQDWNGQLRLPIASFAESATEISTETWLDVYSNESSYSNNHVALKSDSTLWSWGTGGAELGLGYSSSTILSTPVQIPGTTWTKIFGSSQICHAQKSDGTLWGWGENYSGGLGKSGLPTKVSTPVQIFNFGGWKSILTRGQGMEQFYALRDDGSLYASGTFSGYSWPNYHVSSPTLVPGGITWSKVSSGGPNFTLAISTTGALYATGQNFQGQLGVGDNIHRSTFVQVGTDTDWMDVQCSSSGSAIALKTNGTLWRWGYGTYIDDWDGKSTPVQFGSDTTWTKISMGLSHALGLQSNGTIWSWGYGYNYPLGHGNTNNVSLPTQIGVGTTWTDISAGGYSSFAIQSDGTLWSWGTSDRGRTSQSLTRSTPVKIGSATYWARVFAGADNVFMKTITGEVYFAGYNGVFRYSGNPTYNATSYSSPVQQGSANWTTVCSFNTTESSDYGGVGCVHALKPDGTLWTWGRNDLGIAGTLAVTEYSSPVQIGSVNTWSSLSGSNGSYFAIRNDGSMWSWGLSNYGNLGLGISCTISSPTLVSAASTWKSIHVSSQSQFFGIKNDGTLWHWGGPLMINANKPAISPVQVGALTTWSELFSDFYEGNVFARMTDGTLRVWGTSNSYGAMGIGNTTNPISTPTQIGTASDWASVAFASSSTVFLKTNGDMYWCGYNYGMTTGRPFSSGVSTPVLLTSGYPWQKVCATRNANGSFHIGILGMSTSNKLAFFGYNDNFSMRSQVSSPIQVVSGTDWSKISLSDGVACAIKTDGSLWAWGYNCYYNQYLGSVGIGQSIGTKSPIRVGTTTWLSICSSGRSNAGIRSDGTLWIWGARNGSGSYSTPVQVGSHTDWSRISVAGASSNYYYAGLKSNGDLWFWGSTPYGNIVQPTYSSTPVQYGTDTWIDIAGCSTHFLAIKSDGTMWSAGQNLYGQLGQSDYTNRSSLTKIGSASNWAKVTCVADYSMALKTNGTVWHWGGNIISPVQVGTASDWLQIAGGKGRFAIR